MFFSLVFTFFKIGLFSFGGGLAMIALIHDEVVVNHGWITARQLTDIIAVSEMTPGPIGINTATYTGYTALVEAGYSEVVAVAGSVLCSVAVIFLPVLLMVVLLHFLLKHSQHPTVRSVLSMLRFTAIGLIAAAALQLLTPQSFGEPAWSKQFVTSVLIFVVVFGLSIIPRGVAHVRVFGRVVAFQRRVSPILLIVVAALLGVLIYGL
ncbi:MAG: chromate transporter [Bacteroidales bacterium]|nr:chromate transporter [Candidatus Colimorpha onthohippi]